jgi:hypothetical protein
VLSGGLTFKPLSISNDDAQYIESRQFTVEDMARWLRVPPHIIGHLLRSTFSNIEVQGTEYVVYCLLSWARRWEQEIQRKLISPRERTVFAEHLFDGLLRGDIDTRYKAYATARQWGWMSANDVLGKENMNPIGEAGDVYLVPANMMNADRLLEEPQDVVDTPSGNSGNGKPDPETTPEAQSQETQSRRLELAQRLCALLDIDAGAGNGNGSRTAHANGGGDE